MSSAADGARSVKLGSVCMPHDPPQHGQGADQNDCGGEELENAAECAVFGESADGRCEQHKDHGGCDRQWRQPQANGGHAQTGELSGGSADTSDRGGGNQRATEEASEGQEGEGLKDALAEGHGGVGFNRTAEE